MAHRILTSLVGIDATFSSTLSLTSLAGVGNRMLIVNSAGTVSTQAIPTGTVTSVGLSMPSAFTVTNSPVTGAGTLTVTGAGTTLQYIDGTGALQTLPTSTSRVQHQVKAGVAINKGQAVYVTSADGTNMIVGLASNTSEATSSKTMGLLDATVSTNGFANVVTEGLLAGLNTSAAGTEGDPVWLGVNGNLIYGLINKPSAPDHLVFIGIVTRKNSNNGEIFVKVQNGFELQELHNVAISSIANKNLLMYEAATSLWKNNTLGNVIGGLSTQYVKGDGTLGSFPDIGGGGGLVYYLNGSVSGSAAGYYQMSKTPVFGAGADFSLTGNGLIVQFITDANDPSLLSVPSGAWRFGLYASMGTGGNSSKFYVEIYKYDGTTFTLIGSSSGTPESVVNGTAIEYYTTTVAVTTVALAVTDRIAVRVYATDNNTRTMTIHTENSHLCDVATTFPSGISSINGLITPAQYLSTTTTGTDFTISSTSNTHSFNLPVASSTVTGKLSSTDWTTFNNKQNALTNPITGTGTANYLSKFTTATSLANSLVYDNGTNIGIGTATPGYKLDVNGTTRVSGLTTLSSGLLVSSYGSTIAGGQSISGSGSGNFDFNNGSGGGWYFNWTQNGTTAMRLSTGNNLLIGTTTDAGFKLDVNGTTRSQGKLTITTGGAEITGNVVAYTGIQSYGQVQIFSAAAFQMFNAANNSKASFQYINANGLLLTTNSDNISGVLKGLQVNPTMVAAANNDVLVGLDISPTFTVGAFTGVTTLGLRVQSGVSSFGGNVIMNGNNFYLGGNFGNTVIRTISTTNVQIFNNNAGATLFLNANGSVQIGQSSATNWALFSASGHTIYNTTNTYFFSTGNVGINQSSDAGYKLDVGGTTRFQGNIAQSSGTATFANGIILDSTSRIFSGGTTTYQSNSGTSQHLFKNDISNGLSGTIVTISNGSGTFGPTNASNFLNITGRLATISGTNNLTSILLNHTVENTGTYTGTIRGIYYNPSSIVGTGFTHRAIETTTGDVLFGTTSGVVGIGTTTIGTEANLYLGAKSTTEGGQLILQKGTSQTYATHLDNYTDQFRILYGTDTGSTGVALAVAMSNRQLILPAYTTTSSFSGTVVGYLAFDSSGNILTVTAPSGAVTSVNAGTGVSVSSTTGNVTVSIGQSVATSATPSFDQVFATNNGNGTNFKVGDDAWIGDVNTADTLMVMGQQNAANGYIIFGNSNFTALGRSGTGALTYGGYTIYHSNNSNTITALGTITTGVWNGTAITDTYISSASTWNAKQNALTLTTTGTSGAATLVGATLNIPQYQSVLTNPVTGTGAAGQVAYWTGSTTQTGSNELFFDTTNNRLGVGTTTPNKKLEVYKSGLTDGTSDGIRISVQHLSANAQAALEFYHTYGSTALSKIATDIGAGGLSPSMYFIHNSITAIKIANTGNVLVNTTTDSGYKLDINGTARIVGNVGIGTTPGGSDVLTVGGNINLGAYKLYNGSASDSAGLWFNSNVTNISGYSGISFRSSAAGIQVQSIRMTIFPTGNVAIGTTTDSGYMLDVNSTARIVGALTVGATGTDGTINLARGSNGGVTGAIIQTSGITQILNYQGSGIDFYVAGASTVTRAFVRTTGIGITGTSGGNFTMDGSAALQINSTIQGFLPPRMTSSQRTSISTPATGLVVYQTDGVEGLYVYTSSGWKALTMV